MMLNRVLPVTLLFAVLASGCATMKYSPAARDASGSAVHSELFLRVARNACDEFISRFAISGDEISLARRGYEAKKTRYEYSQQQLAGPRLHADRYYLKEEGDRLARELRAVAENLSRLDGYSKISQKIRKSGVHIEVEYLPEMSSSRARLYNVLMEERLRTSGIRIVPTAPSADYRVRVIVNYEGINEIATDAIIFYNSIKYRAVSSVTFVVIDAKSGEFLLSDNISGIAEFEKTKILGFPAEYGFVDLKTEGDPNVPRIIQ